MTFDGSTLTTTDGSSVIDVTTDHSLTQVDSHAVSWGSLSLARITEVDALDGTHGVDCMKVHGDTFERVHGNREVDVNKRMGAAGPAGNVVVTIDGDSTTTYHGNVTMTFQPLSAAPGVFTETYFNKVQRTYLDDTVENHHADYTLNQPDDASLEFKRFDNEAIAEQLSITDLQMELCNFLHLELGLLHGEAKCAHAEAKVIHYEAQLVHKSDVLMELDTHLEDNEINILHNRMSLINGLTSPAHIHTGLHFGTFVGTLLGIVIPIPTPPPPPPPGILDLPPLPPNLA